MKKFAAIALAFVIGVAVTASILPKLGQSEQQAQPTPSFETAVQTETEKADATALAKQETTIPSPETQITEEPAETPEITEVQEQTKTVEESKSTEFKEETTPEPNAEIEQVSSPPVETSQPETWWEDGKQYTMINGHKAYIAPEGNNQQSYYDWESDPLKDVPGPFTGNGN
jgi:hypothetical protein